MSEIRVDTIAEKTTANGVSVDGVLLKDGGATLADNLLFNASGKGVYLGVTSATASNLLDDYEEGTFTVGTDGDATGAFAGSGTAETGEYTKIGNMVFVRITFQVATNFTSNVISGLPFTTNHDTSLYNNHVGNAIQTQSNANGVIFTYVGDNSTKLRFTENNNHTDNHLPNTTNNIYRISFWYYSV